MDRPCPGMMHLQSFFLGSRSSLATIFNRMCWNRESRMLRTRFSHSNGQYLYRPCGLAATHNVSLVHTSPRYATLCSCEQQLACKR